MAPQKKLSFEDEREIAYLHRRGAHAKVLAKEYSVSPALIGFVTQKYSATNKSHLKKLGRAICTYLHGPVYRRKQMLNYAFSPFAEKIAKKIGAITTSPPSGHLSLNNIVFREESIKEKRAVSIDDVMYGFLEYIHLNKIPDNYLKLVNEIRRIVKKRFLQNHYKPLPKNLQSKVESFLDVLNSKERKILKLRYCIDSNPNTLEKVGEKFNVSRERIRQIEQRCISKIRFSGKKVKRGEINSAYIKYLRKFE